VQWLEKPLAGEGCNAYTSNTHFIETNNRKNRYIISIKTVLSISIIAIN
jgi:hypothetical protein